MAQIGIPTSNAFDLSVSFHIQFSGRIVVISPTFLQDHETDIGLLSGIPGASLALVIVKVQSSFTKSEKI